MTQDDVLELVEEWGELTCEELAYLMKCHNSNAGRMCRRLRFYGEIGFFEENYIPNPKLGTRTRYVYYPLQPKRL